MNLDQITSKTADSGGQNQDQQRISCLAWPHLPALASDALVLGPEKEKKTQNEYSLCLLYIRHFKILYILSSS